jgi:hypothetical protein
VADWVVSLFPSLLAACGRVEQSEFGASSNLSRINGQLGVSIHANSQPGSETVVSLCLSQLEFCGRVSWWFVSKVPYELMVLFCSDWSESSDSVKPSRRAFWQPACPFLAFGDHFRPCEAPALTGAFAVSSLPALPATAPGMMPRARGFEILYKIRMAAWMQSLGLTGLFLAALCHSQNKLKRFEGGERFHVSTWSRYCFALIGPTLCDPI